MRQPNALPCRIVELQPVGAGRIPQMESPIGIQQNALPGRLSRSGRNHHGQQAGHASYSALQAPTPIATHGCPLDAVADRHSMNRSPSQKREQSSPTVDSLRLQGSTITANCAFMVKLRLHLQEDASPPEEPVGKKAESRKPDREGK